MTNHKKLTKREEEVLDLVTTGQKNKEVAKELVISESTVENHLRSIYRKLGVKNRTQATYKNLKKK